MNWFNFCNKLNISFHIETSAKPDGAVMLRTLCELMVDAYGFEYKSYPHNSFVILTS